MYSVVIVVITFHIKLLVTGMRFFHLYWAWVGVARGGRPVASGPSTAGSSMDPSSAWLRPGQCPTRRPARGRRLTPSPRSQRVGLCARGTGWRRQIENWRKMSKHHVMHDYYALTLSIGMIHGDHHDTRCHQGVYKPLVPHIIKITVCITNVLDSWRNKKNSIFGSLLYTSTWVTAKHTTTTSRVPTPLQLLQLYLFVEANAIRCRCTWYLGVYARYLGYSDEKSARLGIHT